SPKNRERRNLFRQAKRVPLARFRAERVGFAVCNSHTHKQSSGTLVCFFFVLFLSNKEKGHRSPLSKGNIL
ncbi:MAG: hypothetical protein IJD59_02585, partial [Clostridia bacterium]|nr:hypothetical protein [Clostridia bacterium]